MRQARRRVLALLVIEHLCRAVSAVFLLLAAMLVAGAGVFHPAWPAAALLASAAYVAWQVRRGTPDDYAVARRADAELGLNDLLATAWHLRRNKRPSPGVFEPLVEQKASEACRTADVRAAMPFRWNRSATLAAASPCLALAVLAIRVGVLRSFDLRPPLITVHFDTLTGAPLPPERPPRQTVRKLDLPGFSLEQSSARAPDDEQLPAESLRTLDVGESSAPSPQGSRRTGRQAQPTGANQQSAAEVPEEGDAGQEQGGDRAEGQTSDARNAPPPQTPQDSLLDKMRDALASLMDKLKLEMPPGNGSSASKQGAKQESARRENGRPQPGRKGEQSGEGDMLSSQQQAAADSSRQAKSEQGGRPDASSQNEKSGIGKEEGRKELQQAEDLQAMGKLDELIGKRAQNVQGEVMVEVTSSKNPLLKTPYADQTAPRGDLGSELGRDEVPLHLQDYVQRYYEQIRRIPPQPRP
ncbi:MAG: hypothetical protein ACUVS7_02760 [Bryobacteraceae bacterium]